jgi:hypothetical protein
MQEEISDRAGSLNRNDEVFRAGVVARRLRRHPGNRIAIRSRGAGRDVAGPRPIRDIIDRLKI